MNRTSLSKAVSHALRHAPWQYELELDEAGWVEVGALLDALRRDPRWREVTRDDLAETVARSEKRRFEIDERRIRALYGHSLAGRIAKELGVPPAVLYHGTGAETVPAILDAGLRPMGRQYVHLSVDTATASAVGRRKSSRVTVLVIDAAQAHRSGVTFPRGNEAVWLAEHVPPRFISAGGPRNSAARGFERGALRFR